MDRPRAKTETSIKSQHGEPEIKRLAAAGDGGRHRERRRREAEIEVKWASVSGCRRGLPWDGEGGTGQPGGSSSSTLTQSCTFTGPVARGSH